MPMSRVDSLVLPLVFVGLHVVTYAMMKSQTEQADKCIDMAQKDMDKEEGPNEADLRRFMSCRRDQETKTKLIQYMIMAAVIVGAVWIFRQLEGRAISIGIAALIIPALFFVGETLDACVGNACDAASLATTVVVGPAFWGTVAYTVLQLTHRM